MSISIPHIDIHTDRFGYLSPSSPHSFVINDVIWPSVTHYLLAKRFEGSTLEEKIRKSGLAYALYLAKPKVTPKGNVMYGSQKIGWVDVRSDWSRSSNKYMEEALRAKFTQNTNLMQRLLSTTGMNIEDDKDKEIAKWVMKIRCDLEKEKKAKEPSSLSLSFGASISDDYLYQRVDLLLPLVHKIKRIEGVSKYHAGMFEDALENIIGKRTNRIIKIVGNLSQTWDEICKKYPKFESRVINIRDRITSKKSFHSSREAFLVVFLCLMTAYEIEGPLHLPRDDRIVIPAKARTYRNQSIPSKKIEKEVVSLFVDESHGSDPAITSDNHFTH